MKIKFLIVVMIISGMSAYCGGLTEENLVNEQEIRVEHVDSIEIAYRWEKINLFKNNTDSLIIKEYMSRDNKSYYADITNFNNTVNVNRGKRPFGFLVNTFDVRVDIYIPVSKAKISVKTASGNIALDNIIAGAVNVETSSGNIALDSITADTVNVEASSGTITLDSVTANTIKVKASSGAVRGESINGNANVKTSSGSIVLGSIAGDVSVEASSGSIRCTITENAGNVSLTASSGGVTLNVPQNHAFTFSSRRSSGSLSTPFSDKLFSPVSDRKLAQGSVGVNPDKTITIKTNSGSIKVHWIP